MKIISNAAKIIILASPVVTWSAGATQYLQFEQLAVSSNMCGRGNIALLYTGYFSHSGTSASQSKDFKHNEQLEKKKRY